METALVIFASILLGYFLRDGNIKAIEKKNKHTVEEIKKERMSEVMEYIPPEDTNKTAEQLARDNAKENL